MDREENAGKAAAGATQARPAGQVQGAGPTHAAATEHAPHGGPEPRESAVSTRCSGSALRDQKYSGPKPLLLSPWRTITLRGGQEPPGLFFSRKQIIHSQKVNKVKSCKRKVSFHFPRTLCSIPFLLHPFSCVFPSRMPSEPIGAWTQAQGGDFRAQGRGHRATKENTERPASGKQTHVVCTVPRVCKQSPIHRVTREQSPGSTHHQSQHVLLSTLGLLSARHRGRGTPRCMAAAALHTSRPMQPRPCPPPPHALAGPIVGPAAGPGFCSAFFSNLLAWPALCSISGSFKLQGDPGGNKERARTDSAEPNTTIPNSEYCTLQIPPLPFI